MVLTTTGTARIIDWHAPPAIRELVADLKENGFRISDKSIIVGSSMAVARRVAEKVGEPKVTAALTGKDLGIDFGG